MKKCTVCGNINSEDQQACGVCGSIIAWQPPPASNLKGGPKISLREPATVGKSRGRIQESRNKFWAGLAMLLLFIGILVGTVVLFSYLPSTGPAGTPPLLGESPFDLILIWLALLFAGLAILMKLFKMLTRE